MKFARVVCLSVTTMAVHSLLLPPRIDNTSQAPLAILHAEGRPQYPRGQRSRISEIARSRRIRPTAQSGASFDGKALTVAQESNEETCVPLDLESYLAEGHLRCMSDNPKGLQYGQSIPSPAFRFHALKELFGLEFSKLFHTNAAFREALRSAMRKDVFDTTPAYANLSEKAAAVLLMPDSSLQGSWKKSADMDDDEIRMKETTKVLQTALGGDMNGDEMMHTIGSLCGAKPSTHWIDIVGVQDRIISHSFHQDTGMSPSDSQTVLWGFPPEDNYQGTGVFSHLVALKNECHAPKNHPLMEPVLFDGKIPEKCIVRPEFGRDTELLIYRDIDVLHSSPDVAYRTSVMRFM